MHNTYIVPVELSWKFGDQRICGEDRPRYLLRRMARHGADRPWQPGQSILDLPARIDPSYLKDGWNLTAAMYYEDSIPPTRSQLHAGDIFHADFTATKTIGKWTFGPVAYYVGQVTERQVPVGVCSATGAAPCWQHPEISTVWRSAALVGYNFGPASLSVWATQEVSAKASNAALPLAELIGSLSPRV